MKIALVSDAVYPYHKGGKERRIHELSIRMAENGHDVHIYCMKWWKKKENVIKENNITLHAISPYYPLYKGKRRSIKQGILFGLHCLNLIKEEWDVIEVDHMPYFPLFFTKIVCILKGKKMVATWHEVWGRTYWVKYLGLLGYLSAFIESLTVWLPDTFISVSDHTTRRLIDMYSVPKSKIVIVPNGIHYSYIQSIPASPHTCDIFYAGRLLAHKNVNVLLDAIAILVKKNPTLCAIIIGNGPERKNLHKKAEALGLEKNITFIDFLPHHEDLFAYMKSSKVFVLPSTREGFGLAVLEANACGIPAIVIDHASNAARDLITKATGATIKLDPEQMASQIEYFLTNQLDREKMMRSAEKYRWSKLTREVINAYKR